MPTHRYERQPFVLDLAGDEGEERASGETLTDAVASSFGGLTIVSAPDDSS
jgi:hypothetical protein